MSEPKVEPLTTEERETIRERAGRWLSDEAILADMADILLRYEATVVALEAERDWWKETHDEHCATGPCGVEYPGRSPLGDPK